MPHAASPDPARLVRDELEPWTAVGVTGALRVLDPPGGTVYLTNGRISYAECPAACGVDRLLTASGRLPAETWRSALAAGRAGRRVGEALVSQGLLAPAELEAVVLAALYGAAHFLLNMDSAVRFEMGAGHALGSVVELDVHAVRAELDRRGRLLADAWPDSRVDTHAIVPARRLPGHQVALTALQWEIVANADRRRTPMELARSLGRDTFATLLEVRRLARAGLVEPGRPGGVASAPRSAARARDAPPGVAKPPPVRAVGDRDDGGPAAGDGPPAVPEYDPDGWPDEPVLPCRGAQRPAPWRAVLPDLPDLLPPPCSDSTLVRIRDALEAMR